MKTPNTQHTEQASVQHSHTTERNDPLTRLPLHAKPEKRLKHWQTGSAIGMLTTGTLLSVAGFCVPPLGEISESVLWFFGQCLLYAGSILGVGAYVNCKIREMGHRFNG